MSSSPQLVPKSPILDEALQRRNMLVRAQTSSKRLVTNLVVAGMCLYDANHQCVLRLLSSSPPTLASWLTYIAEMLVFAVCITNVLAELWTQLSPLHGLPPLALTDKQFKLLRLTPGSPGFTRSPEKKSTSYPNPFTPLPGPLLASSNSPSSPTSPSTSVTPGNVASRSWLSSSSPSSPSTSPCSPISTNQKRDHYPDSPSVTDEAGLASYLSSFHSWEQSQVSNLSLDDSGSQVSQSLLFWRPGIGGSSLTSPQGKLDFSPAAGQAKQVYQLSTPSPPTSASSATGEKEKASDDAKASVLSQRLGIDPLDLVGWNENLRVWVTQTVLRPLVSEIDSVNTALPKHGVTDCLIGQAAVERLRKVSALPQVSQHITHLAVILPYLEVCTDQTYLVARLRELAKTGALSLYRWNGGGDGWTERLPTDSEILVHCIATYLDCRLLTSASMRLAGTSNPQADSMKPFTGVAFFRHGEKPDVSKDQDVLAIVQVGRSPPHYVVQVGSRQLDVGTGRNNLIHTLLLFLHRVKQDRHGMLGRINLGLSGLNILWVLD